MSQPDQPIPFSIDGRTAIITGAGSGIGLAFATILLSKNCNVVIADLALRPEAQLLLDQHKENREGRARAIFVQTDVTKWPDLTRMFEAAEEAFGEVDIVCPGAGVFDPHWSNLYHPPGSAESKDSPTGGADGTGHYALFDINLIHPIRTTQLAMFRWLNPKQGQSRVSSSNPKRVVHISSIAAQVPTFPAPLYAASKAGVSSLIRSLGLLDEIGIRVNGVAPGLIRTPLWLEHPEKLLMLDQAQDTWVEPEEVASALLQCVIDDSVGGGVVLEVLKDATRHVDWRMDPGPSPKAGSGATASNAKVAVEQVFGWLSTPGQ